MTNRRTTTQVDDSLIEFKGQVLEFMRRQDEVNQSFNHFLVNCFPHFTEAIGNLEGSVSWIKWALAGLITVGISAGLIDAISVFK